MSSLFTLFPAATAATFQVTMVKTGWTWDNAGEWDRQTWQAVIAMYVVADF